MLLVTALLLVEIAATLLLPALATYIVPFSVVWMKTGFEPSGKLVVVTGLILVRAYEETVSSRLLAT